MITEPMRELKLSPEDEAILQKTYSALCQSPACMEHLAKAKKLFFETGSDFVPEVNAAAEKLGIHRFTVALVFLLSCAEQMKQNYQARSYSPALYRDGLADIGVKAAECKRVYGVVGIFVLFWYPNLFTCRRFILGRLEYEQIEFPRDSYRGLLKKGDPVLNLHIPSSGALPQEAVLDSLKRAYDFYPALRYHGLLPVYCHSWLFYPPTAALYKRDSNLDKFCRNFEVLSEQEVSNEVNFWRVFDRPWSPEALENAPESTSLQRAFKQYLLGGGKMGVAEVLLFFDGKRIIPQQP